MAAHTLSSHSHTLSTFQTNRLVAAKLTIPNTVEVAEVKKKKKEECEMCHLIDTKAVVYQCQGDLHLFTAAPPSLFSCLFFSLPHYPPLHCHNPPCLWWLCMKWILPHPAGKILISFLLYLRLLSPLSS